MGRSEWVREMRRQAEERYDTLWAPGYGEQWGTYSNATHQEYIRKLLERLPEHGTILDAACGAGRYLPMLLEQGHTVLGIDQSQGMLSRLKAKFPFVQVEKIGLQELHYQEVFDGAICMDAMENVFPEDWLPVLGNFHRSLKPGGTLYFTVEIAEQGEIEAAFHRGIALGLPIVYGEWADGDVYHFYPSIARVREWMREAGFDLSEEGQGDGYWHFILRR